jgi:hypothetical protein
LLESFVLVLRFSSAQRFDVAVFALKAALAVMPLAMCLALTSSPSAYAHKKVAYTSAKWLTVKAERGAEVVIVETEYTSALRVISGTATVRNGLDHSVVRLGAGTAYETNVRPDPMKRDPIAFIEQAPEIIALFETKSNTSYLYRTIANGRLKAEIIDPPMTQNYSIGDVAASKLPMSRMLTTHFPPAGVVVWHPPAPALAEQSGSN